MKIKISKYQGAGNDFIIVDNRDGSIQLTPEQIKLLCDRRFGIGADGLMYLEKSHKFDFGMKYFNADGFEGSMCGNGGRCLVAFAAHSGIKKFEFEAVDGYHKAELHEFSERRCIIELGMINVDTVKKYSANSYFLNTGSPHLVIFTDNLKKFDVEKEGKYWRYHADFHGGTNVNFVEVLPDRLFVRTYERGVEAETYACGTGVTASAIAWHEKRYNSCERSSELITTKIEALGDKLEVSFKKEGSGVYRDIQLKGPATFVFDCIIDI